MINRAYSVVGYPNRVAFSCDCISIARFDPAITAYLNAEPIAEWPAGKWANRCLRCGRVFFRKNKFDALKTLCRVDGSVEAIAELICTWLANGELK